MSQAQLHNAVNDLMAQDMSWQEAIQMILSGTAPQEPPHHYKTAADGRIVEDFS